MSDPAHFENLDDWLTWLEGHHPKDIDLGLERIRRVALRLDLLKPAAQVISIAGTNGKGSCVAVCSTLLQNAGWRVGSYTSPHLLRYNERILIDGVPATDAEICAAFARIVRACSDTSLTYFEFGTLAALEIFRQRAVDVMVLEVGLGGRLDAVNLLDADLAVVTSIDLDHQEWLGSDRDSIGREKAGIYRPGRPALCADLAPPEGLLRAAGDAGVALQCAGTDPQTSEFGFSDEGRHWRCWGRLVGGDGGVYQLSGRRPPLPLPSVAAAVQVVAHLGVDPRTLDVQALLQGLSLPGRFQRLACLGREFILDVAHNPAAAELLAKRLAAEEPRRRLALVAMMADKDRRAMLAALQPQVQHWWLAELPGNQRAATTGQLQGDLHSLGVRASGCGTVSAGIDWLLAHSREGDQVVIMGSFYTVAAALQRLEPLVADSTQRGDLRDETGGETR